MITKKEIEMKIITLEIKYKFTRKQAEIVVENEFKKCIEIFSQLGVYPTMLSYYTDCLEKLKTITNEK